MSNQSSAVVRIGDENHLFQVREGSEGELGIDIGNLRATTGHVSYDEGFANTAACESKVTFIDGEKGILRYRGFPIEQLAENSTFIETAHLIIYGELPTRRQMSAFSQKVLRNANVHEGMRHLFEGFPNSSPPMAILSALLNSLGCYYPELASNNRERDMQTFDEAATLLLSKVRTIAAMSYRMKHGKPFIYPRLDLGYSQNFLHMMFTEPYHEYYPHDDVTKALDLIFLLHADHEQNCSTSTVRMVASGGANLFASVSAGVSALWGPLHGGANMAVMDMLEKIHASGDDGTRFVEEAKAGKRRLMGFGHRVYKNYDPRAKILKEACTRVLKTLGRSDDPLLDIAHVLEEKAIHDPYFIERRLYPNVDFYSGIILRAIGIPQDMYTVVFAIGRMPGWIAHWKEVAENPKGKIQRPRQIYVGSVERPYVPMRDRTETPGFSENTAEPADHMRG